ncbi:hypothetical protein FRC04_005399 [Tulasnella sp. 424]|nr:hypothetical protein FRC04_005399 [Tulasnella sp. 424]KAG8964787.1 hypothetical protein FRC05_003577 [Tulasnella sp. 425]
MPNEPLPAKRTKGKKNQFVRNTSPQLRSGPTPSNAPSAASESLATEIGRRGSDPSLIPPNTPSALRPTGPETPVMSIGGMPQTPAIAKQTVRLNSPPLESPPHSAPNYPTPFRPTNLTSIREQHESTSDQETKEDEEKTPSKYWNKPDFPDIEDDTDEPYAPVMAHAKCRSVMLLGISADRAREERLYDIHTTLFPSDPIEDCWMDPKHESGDLHDIFELMDNFIRARAVCGRTDYYYVDRHAWGKLHFELTKLYQSRQRFEPGWKIDPPLIWPGKFRNDSDNGEGEYNFVELEEYCIL